MMPVIDSELLDYLFLHTHKDFPKLLYRMLEYFPKIVHPVEAINLWPWRTRWPARRRALRWGRSHRPSEISQEAWPRARQDIDRAIARTREEVPPRSPCDDGFGAAADED